MTIDTFVPRPTPRLCDAQKRARSADVLLDPAELGSARATRHSFARSFLRVAADQRWTVERRTFEVDGDGRGEITYHIDADGTALWFAVFSTTIDQAARTDRVIAEAWDVTAALGEGPLDSKRLGELRRHVPRQEGGRADGSTLVWARANRSVRFFDYVVDRLANGFQPEREVIGDGAYVLRSTAFYANGKWGLTDFGGIDQAHPLAVPYRAQMLAAWLLREVSYDLVEHCARSRSDSAVKLADGWDRYFGLGNATGLGMVPFVIRHPRILDAWVAVRELPLANALAKDRTADSDTVARVERHLRRAVRHFAERDGLACAPYQTGPELAAGLAPLADRVATYRDTGIPIDGSGDLSFSAALHTEAAKHGLEVRQIVDTVLVECEDEIDAEVEGLLRCNEAPSASPTQSCGGLIEFLDKAYAWVKRFDFSNPARTHHFWYCSANSEEPRRGRRGLDEGEPVAFPIDIARQVNDLMADLSRFSSTACLAEFLVSHPWHRGIVERAQSLVGVPYGEAHVNPLDQDFLPLDLQRFQLALYGMENFNPQSTDWLRVTLFSGAPRVAEVAVGVDDDWLFNLKPGSEQESE